MKIWNVYVPHSNRVSATSFFLLISEAKFKQLEKRWPGSFLILPPCISAWDWSINFFLLLKKNDWNLWTYVLIIRRTQFLKILCEHGSIGPQVFSYSLKWSARKATILRMFFLNEPTYRIISNIIICLFSVVQFFLVFYAYVPDVVRM